MFNVTIASERPGTTSTGYSSSFHALVSMSSATVWMTSVILVLRSSVVAGNGWSEVSMEQRRDGRGGRGRRREVPEKTRRPAASSGTIPTCDPARGMNPVRLGRTRINKGTLSTRESVEKLCGSHVGFDCYVEIKKQSIVGTRRKFTAQSARALYNPLSPVFPRRLGARAGPRNERQDFGGPEGGGGEPVDACAETARASPYPPAAKSSVGRESPTLRAASTSRQPQGHVTRGKREIPEKTHRPADSSGAIPTCENPGVTRQGIEPGLPLWEASRLTAHPQFPPSTLIHILKMRYTSNPIGPAVAEWLACSPPTKANQVQSPAGSPDFHKLVDGFSRGSPIYPTLHSGAAPCSLCFALIGSQDRHLSTPLIHEIFLTNIELRVSILASPPPLLGELGSISAGSPSDFHMLESYQTMPLVCGFSRGVYSVLEKLALLHTHLDHPQRHSTIRKWSGVRTQGLGKWEVAEKTHRPAASSGTIPI
ncbi:hypothetical protein PR048_031148 [Dryococelus australis]|uniref:Uncharacterized protein n=1 Tax=Dryococelus australis TaxID=614101 RepID=A0ABQ9G5K9_9NEOP|nr:hypothetical protein PR048_031148 [Dryococelus australis]